jgi:hypothetical protein
MRFSNFAAFMLPLAAFAAPTPQSASPLQMARGNYNAALVQTSAIVSMIVDRRLGAPSQVTDARVINDTLRRTFTAAQNINAAVLAGNEPSRNECVDNPFTRVHRWVKIINTAIFCSCSECDITCLSAEIRHDLLSLEDTKNGELAQLASDAIAGANKMVEGALNILDEEGKTLEGLGCCIPLF